MAKKKYDGWVIERTTRDRMRFLVKECFFHLSGCGKSSRRGGYKQC